MGQNETLGIRDSQAPCVVSGWLAGLGLGGVGFPPVLHQAFLPAQPSREVS